MGARSTLLVRVRELEQAPDRHGRRDRVGKAQPRERAVLRGEALAVERAAAGGDLPRDPIPMATASPCRIAWFPSNVSSACPSVWP